MEVVPFTTTVATADVIVVWKEPVAELPARPSAVSFSDPVVAGREVGGKKVELVVRDEVGGGEEG